VITFENRVVIVTGAGGGLGRCYALDIARRGGAVVVNDLGGSVEGTGGSSEMANQVVAEIRALGGRAIANADSVACEEGAQRIAEAALDNFGRIDGLINNAGNMRNAPFEDSRLEDLEAQIAVHLVGSYNITKAVWRQMKAQGYGRVVFTTSSAGMFGNPTQSGYGAAKAGVTGLMNVVANEGQAFGILCNGLMPNAMSRMARRAAEGMDLSKQQEKAPFMAELGNAMDLDFNTGIAVYLASESCQTTHGIYSSCAGRIARVFVGATEGWQGSRQQPATAEDIAANFAQIQDLRRGIHLPMTPIDEHRIAIMKPMPVA
jgi:NAD(P)-dependent dehydrogenase (short-subunit alcohol dehydrogenase family)